MKRVESQILIEELQTGGHSPLQFICSDGAVYYVKYRSGKSLDKREIQCLVYEMVCTALLQQLQIPTPENALVAIAEHSYAKGQIVISKRYIKPGIIGLGSKEIVNADLVKEMESVSNRKQFNRLLNPDDLIRIAVFDLWVDNVDRHSENYNLLTRLEDNKLRFYAIDHAFCFGGLNGMNTFNERSTVSTYKKLIVSQYFRSVVKHYRKAQRLDIVNDCLSLVKQLNLAKVTNEVLKEIPPQWNVSPMLRDRMLLFLQSKQRLLQVEHVAMQALSKL